MNKNLKLLFGLFLLIFIFAAGGFGVYGYYLLTQQNQALNQKTGEMEKLQHDQESLKKKLMEAEEKQKKTDADNQSLAADKLRYEKEKEAILGQVKNSVAGFEAYRSQASDETKKLKDSVTELEGERKVLVEQLQSAEELSAKEKDTLSGQVKDLERKIEIDKKAQSDLAAQLAAKESTNIARETAKLHYNLGNFYFRSREYKKAAWEFEKALLYENNDADAHFNLAVVCDDYIGDIQAAKDHYKKYLELKPGVKDFKKIQQRVLDLDLREQVYLDEPKKHLPRNPENPEALISNFTIAKDKK